MHFLRKYFYTRQREAVLFFLICMSIATLFFFLTQIGKSHQAKITFLNVGQGDAILIQTPHGRKVLIDAGPDEQIEGQLDRVIPYYDRTLDLAFATHPDVDHVGGFLSLIEHYTIKSFFHSGLLVAEPEYAFLAKNLQKEGIPTRSLKSGDVITLGDGMKLFVLSPYRVEEVRDANEASLVLLLTYQGTQVLFMGDAPRTVEAQLKTSYGEALRSPLLKLGHHGSKTSSSEDFLRTVQPQEAIVSAGCKNRFGHPHQEVVALLRKLGIQERDTCFDGNIQFVFQNGKWVYQE